jgi:2-methylisocitrate lyase-like PEP mutase family enzyme
MLTGPHTGAKRLRELLSDRSKIVVCPSVYDGLTARIAISQGFDALYMVVQTPPKNKTNPLQLT